MKARTASSPLTRRFLTGSATGATEGRPKTGETSEEDHLGAAGRARRGARSRLGVRGGGPDLHARVGSAGQGRAPAAAREPAAGVRSVARRCVRALQPAAGGRARAGEHGVLRRARAGEAQDLPGALGLGAEGRLRPQGRRPPGVRSRRCRCAHDRLHQGDGRDRVDRQPDPVLPAGQRVEAAHRQPDEPVRRGLVGQHQSDQEQRQRAEPRAGGGSARSSTSGSRT